MSLGSRDRDIAILVSMLHDVAVKYLPSEDATHLNPPFLMEHTWQGVTGVAEMCAAESSDIAIY